MARVYVSSTYRDLVEHRRRVCEVLRDRHYDVICMEDYGSCEERPPEKCLDDVASCDVYIGIFAWRYGHVPPGQELSITELEYRQAGRLNQDRLIFLSDEAAAWRHDMIEVGTGGEKIERFRQELGENHVVSYFKDVEDLAKKVATSIDRWAHGQLDPSRRSQVPQQAPRLPPHYIERTELEIVKQKIMGDDNLIALHGMGGLGKTTLAQALANDPEVVRHFKDGILWAKLGTDASVERWQVAWGASLGDDLRLYFDAEAKATRLRTLLVNKQCLLVIDDVWSEADIRHLLVGGRDCRTLITTRHGEVVGQVGATPLVIDVLEETEALRLLGNWAGCDLNADSNARKLVRRLGYLPLAVTLAGAQLRDGATLGELLGALVGDKGNLANLDLETSHSKEWSLLLTFELSVQRLDPESQKRFAQLGVLAVGEGFDAETAAVVWEDRRDKQTRDSLRLLVRHALLSRMGNSYRMHVLLRDYASLLLDEMGEDERTRAESRHTEYCLYVAKKAGDDWHVTEAAMGQIRSAWQRVEKSDSEQIFAFVDTMTPFFMRRGLLHEAVTWIEKGITLAEKRGNYDDGIRYLNSIGNIYMRLGLWEKAEDYFLKALERAESTGNFLQRLWTMQYLGCLCRNRGDFPQAMVLYQQALTLAEQRVGVRHQLVGGIYNELGAVYRAQGAYSQAIEFYEKALEITEPGADDKGVADIFSNLGSVYLQQDRFESALLVLNRAMDRYLKCGDAGGVARTHNGLSAVYAEQGKYEQAIEIAQKGLEIMLGIGEQQGIVDIYISLGNSQYGLGRNAEAFEMFQNALTICARMGDEPGCAQAYSGLGTVHQAIGEVEQALECYHKALAITERIGDRHNTANSYFNLGNIYRQQGNVAQARAHYQKAKALYEMVGDARHAQQVAQAMVIETEYSLPELLHDLAAVSQEQDRFNVMLEFFRRNLRFMLRQGDERNNASIYLSLGVLYRRQGDAAQARAHYQKAKALFEMAGDVPHAQQAAQALREL